MGNDRICKLEETREDRRPRKKMYHKKNSCTWRALEISVGKVGIDKE